STHLFVPSVLSTRSLHDALPICHDGTGFIGERLRPLSDALEAASPFDHVKNFGERRVFIIAIAQNRVHQPAFFLRRLLERVDKRSEEHTSELQSPYELVCRLLLE